MSNKLKFGVKFNRYNVASGHWCFGASLASDYGEFYLFISLFAFGVSIGRMRG